jgi:hypothetical protein
VSEATYVTSLHEAFWGITLIAVIIAIHGAGVIVTLRTGRALQRSHSSQRSFFHGMGTLIVTTLILVLVHFFEIIVWGTFLWGKGAFATTRDAVYYALMQYTTVSSSLQLPDNLRLLGGVIPLSGMLTVAWSTSVLFLLSQPFVARYSEADGPVER